MRQPFVPRSQRRAGFSRAHNASVRETSPFADKTARRGVVWLEPELHAEISYAEVIQGRLRAPGFRGLITPAPRAEHRRVS